MRPDDQARSEPALRRKAFFLAVLDEDDFCFSGACRDPDEESERLPELVEKSVGFDLYRSLDEVSEELGAKGRCFVLSTVSLGSLGLIFLEDSLSLGAATTTIYEQSTEADDHNRRRAHGKNPVRFQPEISRTESIVGGPPNPTTNSQRQKTVEIS